MDTNVSLHENGRDRGARDMGMGWARDVAIGGVLGLG
jgi:hypothetical protein